LEVDDPWVWTEKIDLNRLRIFWPDPPGGYVLQQSTNILSTSSWQTVTLPVPLLTNGERQVAMDMTNEATYFRTSQP
jgi:hypothetical protein